MLMVALVALAWYFCIWIIYWLLENVELAGISNRGTVMVGQFKLTLAFG